EGAQRRAGVRGRDAVGVVRAHGGQRGEEVAGGDLRELPQPPRGVESAGPPAPDLRVLGGGGALLRVGAPDVPHAVRDRVELPADESGAGPDPDPAPRAAGRVTGAVAGGGQRGGGGGPGRGLPRTGGRA